MFNNAASKAGTWVAEVKELPYAVFDETTGTLSFVRAKEVHGNNSTGTVTSISGGEYTGRVFTVDETGNTLTQPTWTSIQSQVKKVVFVDEIKPKNLYRWFFKCSECTEFNLDKLNTENTVRMRQMFAGCTKIENLDGVKDFKTSNVEDMQAVFAGCSHLTSLDLSMWDTSRVTNMGGLFAYCSRITDLSSIEKWNVSSLMVAQGDVGYTNFSSGMFAETKVSSLNLSNWIPQQSCDMRGMFASMYDLESLNISGFVMTDNTNTDYMFNGSRNLKNWF